MWFEIDNIKYWVLRVSHANGLDGKFWLVECTMGPGCSVQFSRYISTGSRVNFLDEYGFCVDSNSDIVINSREELDAIMQRLETELAISKLED